MARWLLLSLTLALLAAPIATGAQEQDRERAEVSPRIEPGRTLVYALGFELSRGAAPGEGGDRLIQEAGVRLRVAEVGEGGIATVEGGFEWVVIELDRPTMGVRVDSRELGEGEAEEAPNLAERTVRELARAYMDSTFTLRVGPAGEVRGASGLEAVERLVAATPGTLARLAAGRLTLETLSQDLEPVWHADGAAGRAVTEGEEWTTSRTNSLGAGVDLKLRTTWRATSATDDRIEMAGDVTAELSLPEMDQEIPVSFEVTDQEGEASSVWDREAGAMRERTGFMSYTVSVSVGEESRASQQSGRSTLELVSATDGE